MKQKSQKQFVSVDLPVEFLKDLLARQLGVETSHLVDCIVATCDNKEALMHVLLGTFEEPKFFVGDRVYCTDTYYHREEGADEGTYVEYGECVVKEVNPFTSRYVYVLEQVLVSIDDDLSVKHKTVHCNELHLNPVVSQECDAVPMI
jgi:hypothetical protein